MEKTQMDGKQYHLLNKILSQAELLSDYGMEYIPPHLAKKIQSITSALKQFRQTVLKTGTKPNSFKTSNLPKKPSPLKPKTISMTDFAEIFSDQPVVDIDNLRKSNLNNLKIRVTDCTACLLAKSKTNTVFGQGPENARLMFIGEAPGQHEDQRGLPFVGRAGKLLDNIIVAMKIKRQAVYITNVVKCRPPGNRLPSQEEVSTCLPFLWQQIEIIQPKVIITLGSLATKILLDSKEPISMLRGRFHDYPRNSKIRVMPTFHPSYLLRKPENKKMTWEDVKQVMRFFNST